MMGSLVGRLGASKALQALLLCAAIALFILSLNAAHLLERANLAAYDLLIGPRTRQAPLERIVIVDFDERTVSKTGFPVPRQALAAVLRQVSTWKPEVVGLDVILSDHRDAAGDDALESALADAGNVILASSFGTDRLPDVRPLERFASASLDTGFVNLWLDADSHVRRMFLAISTPYYQGLSFPAALATNFLGKPLVARGASLTLGGLPLPSDGVGPGTMLIGGWSDRWAERTVSARDLIEGKATGPRPAKSLVIVGSSSRAAKDLFATPVKISRGPGARYLSGAEIHASAAATLIGGGSITPLGRAWEVGIGLIAVFLALLACLGLRPAWGIAVGLALGLGVAGFAYLLIGVQHLFLPFASTEVGLAIALPVGLGVRIAAERRGKAEKEAEWKQLMGIFERYVSPEVAREIWERRGEIVLAGQEVVATVLFSDIRSYTALTAGKSPTDVLSWLNDYFTEMSKVVKQRGGFLNKFIGDGMMVVFGVPISHGAREDARSAVRAALDMLEAVERLNLQAGKGRPIIKIGVGLHTGVVTAGNVGSVDRLEYSVIGDTVNLASRLESLTKEMGSSIVLSPTTHDLVKDDFQTRPLGKSPVRGFPGEVPLYGVEGAQTAPLQESGLP